VNPKTNTPYDTGVLTAAAIQAGFKNKVAAQSIADRQRALDQSDARLKETIAHNQAIENNASASLQERRVAQANLQAARRQQQANAAARLKLAQQAAAAKKTAKGSGGAGGKTQVAIGKTVASAAAYATSLGKATVKHGATVNPDGTVKGAGTGPKYTPQKIYQLVYARYSRSLFAYYRQLYPNKPKGFYQPYVDKAIHQAVYGN
jgi:hypothetical protein